MLLSVNLQPLKQGLFAIGLLTLFSFIPAQAELVFCNQSGQQIDLSLLFYKSENDGWTAKGWYGVDDNYCEVEWNSDIDKTIYFHVDEFTYSSYDTYHCVDGEYEFETVWDDDGNNPYYKDLYIINPSFDSCGDLSSNHERVGFKKITGTTYWDHCVVAFGEGGSFSSRC